MTTEEKAKAYDEALEQAREMLKSKRSVLVEKQALVKIFPELRESEDEEKRKRVIECLKLSLKGAEDQNDAGCDRTRDIDALKWGIAYLEKQKSVPALDRGDEIILKAICEELKDAPGWVERIEGWYRLAKDAQQYAEWSDEDEKMLHIVITDINYAQRHFSDSKLVPYGKKVDWLRDFRERFKSLEPQPTQEWSDEDEKMISALIRNQEILIDSASNEQLRDIYSKEIQWLKSLRPQPHWKPSEEQMKDLFLATREGCDAGSPVAETLKSLHADLKKL